MGFKPDYGLRLVVEGISPSEDLFFYGFNAFSITILDRNFFSTVVETLYDGVLHALSLDFDRYQLEQILSKADSRVSVQIWTEISRNPEVPRSIDLKEHIVFSARARLGKLQQAEKEEFVPLIAYEIL